MTKIHHRMLLYAVGGVFSEVLFTALKSLALHRDITLHGNTQLWVIILYSLGGLWFEVLERLMRDYSLPKRVPVYVMSVWTIEYIAGMALVYLIGDCPWRYHEWSNIHGLIQLNYFPVWAVMSIVADRLILYLRTHEVKKKKVQNAFYEIEE
jgi:uncharacterized membrane protein